MYFTRILVAKYFHCWPFDQIQIQNTYFQAYCKFSIPDFLLQQLQLHLLHCWANPHRIRLDHHPKFRRRHRPKFEILDWEFIKLCGEQVFKQIVQIICHNDELSLTLSWLEIVYNSVF